MLFERTDKQKNLRSLSVIRHISINFARLMEVEAYVIFSLS